MIGVLQRATRSSRGEGARPDDAPSGADRSSRSQRAPSGGAPTGPWSGGSAAAAMAARLNSRAAQPLGDGATAADDLAADAHRRAASPMAGGPRTPVMAKLRVGSASDPLEADADHVADQLAGAGAGAGSCSCGATCSTCTSSAPRAVRRATASSAPAAPATTVPDSFLSALGSGRAIDADTRSQVEPRLGRDLGDVRIHTGDAATRAAGSIDALAFTVGRDIVFSGNQYEPHTDAGRRLLAHELAHVAQQDGVGGPPMIQRVGAHDPPFGYFPAERKVKEQADASRKAEEERHRKWAQSHQEQHLKALAAQPKTLAQDIASTEGMVVEQRMAVLREAAKRAPAPDPFAGFGSPTGMVPPSFLARPTVPADLGEKWARAHQQVVVVETLVKSQVLTPEAATSARAAFVDFYRALLPMADAADAADQDQQRISEALAQPGTAPSYCKGGCHAPTGPAPSRPLFQAPPPRAPDLRDSLGLTERAASDDEWRTVVQRFATATRVMDSLALSTIPFDSPAAQGLTYAQGLLERQQELQRTTPGAIRIPAVFYPEDKWVTTEDGEKREVANGIPWFFYLTHSPPMNGMYDYPSGFQWTLRDLTSPKRPEVSYPLSDTENFTRSYNRLRADEPPPALFRRLNNELVFPKGMLYWVYPSGKVGQLETTEPWSLSKWLGMIGMGIAALALILGTAGLATPAVLAGLGILGAAAGIGSTLADLNERSELGILTQADKDKAILFIAADLASALTLGLGRAASGLARGAAAGSRATKLAFVVQRAATGAGVADRVLGATVMITVTADLVEQYQTIQQSNLPQADKEAALQRLALTGLMTGAMMVVPHVAGRGPHGPEVPGGTAPRAEPTGGQPAAKGQGDVITVTRGPGEPEAGWSRPKGDTEFLQWSKQQERLRPDKAAQELRIAQEEGTKRPLADDPVYSHELEINGHTWRQRRDGRGWCRFTTKVCYGAGELKVGATGEGARVSDMATAADVAAFRAKDLARPPSSVTTDQGRLDWADYRFYADRRLRMIEEALAAGRTAPPPPRTFASFQQAHPPGSIVRNEIQGARFEARTSDVFKDVVAPERRDLVVAQAHMSESTTPTRGKGELTRADFAFPNAQAPGWTAVTNKSRSSFVDASPAETNTRVIRDLEEAVEKYSGQQQLRRTGEQVTVTRIWLLYDGAMVPSRLQPTVRKTVRDFQRQYRDTGLVFEVGIF